MKTANRNELLRTLLVPALMLALMVLFAPAANAGSVRQADTPVPTGTASETATETATVAATPTTAPTNTPVVVVQTRVAPQTVVQTQVVSATQVVPQTVLQTQVVVQTATPLPPTATPVVVVAT